MHTMHCEDIFLLPTTLQEAVCITTNGIVKTNGLAVMGKGIALEADRRFGVSRFLGRCLSTYGNRAFWLGCQVDAKTGRAMNMITFPTKNDWWDPSSIDLIKESCKQVTAIADKYNLKTIYLPCPGCSNGGLDWETQVKTVVSMLLDDRFIVADKRL